MDRGEDEYAGLPEPLQASVRAYLANLKISAILTEMAGVLEATAAGARPNPEALAGIRRGIEEIRRDNQRALAALGDRIGGRG